LKYWSEEPHLEQYLEIIRTIAERKEGHTRKSQKEEQLAVSAV
jgi:hypothetical protein